jgi:ABC-type uncharacterized transport system auxiliary subunit
LLPLVCGRLNVYCLHIQTSTHGVTTSYAGARNNIQIGTNDNTKKGLTNRSNIRTPSRNIELYDSDKWTTPLIEMQKLHNFKKFQTKIKLESE